MNTNVNNETKPVKTYLDVKVDLLNELYPIIIASQNLNYSLLVASVGYELMSNSWKRFSSKEFQSFTEKLTELEDVELRIPENIKPYEINGYIAYHFPVREFDGLISGEYKMNHFGRVKFAGGLREPRLKPSSFLRGLFFGEDNNTYNALIKFNKLEKDFDLMLLNELADFDMPDNFWNFEEPFAQAYKRAIDIFGGIDVYVNYHNKIYEVMEKVGVEANAYQFIKFTDHFKKVTEKKKQMYEEEKIFFGDF